MVPKRSNIVCTIVLLCSLSCRSFPVSRYPPTRYPPQQLHTLVPSTHRQLLPLSSLDVPLPTTNRCFDDQGRFGDDGYTLAVVQEGDLVDLARLTVEVFGTEVVRIGGSASSIESMLITPAVELVNGYSGLVAFAEVLAGLRSRTRDRRGNDDDDDWIGPPDLGALASSSRDEQISRASSTSLVLAVGRQKQDTSWQSEIIASVELRLQPCDAKIPFTLPWIDRIERRLATLVGIQPNKELQPYLSNLCVDEKFRGQGLGKALVALVEDIASAKWGYSKLYLHVDPDNEAAFGLYKNTGYKEAKLRWKPAWAGSSSAISYLVKSLDDSKRS